MKLGGLGWPELLIILVIILIIFGPRLIPRLGKSLKRTKKNFSSEMKADEVEEGAAGKVDGTRSARAKKAKPEQIPAQAQPVVSFPEQTEPVETSAADAQPVVTFAAQEQPASAKPAAADTWVCQSCGAQSTGRFCGECGAPVPANGSDAAASASKGDAEPVVTF